MGFFVSSQASKLKHNPKKANVEKNGLWGQRVTAEIPIACNSLHHDQHHGFKSISSM